MSDIYTVWRWRNIGYAIILWAISSAVMVGLVHVLNPTWVIAVALGILAGAGSVSISHMLWPLYHFDFRSRTK